MEENERADGVAREAADLLQDSVPVDIRTITRAVARAARDDTVRAWPAGWFRSLMGDRLPPPVAGLDRERAVDVHQLRAGHFFLFCWE